jgi:hypothetical protein
MSPVRRAALIVAGLLAGASSPALAQPINASPATETCALDVFSSPLPTGPEKKTAFIKIAGASPDPFYWGNLSHPTQRLADVSDDDIRQALGLGSDYQVVRHTDRAIMKDLAKSPAPLVARPPRCHAELLAYEGIHLRNRITGREEFAFRFHYREYVGSETPRLEVDDKGGAVADQFKDKTEADREKALADLRAASRELLTDFGRKVARKRDAAAGR